MSGLQMTWVSDWHRQTRERLGYPATRSEIDFARAEQGEETAEEREERIMAAIRNIGR